MLISNSSPSAVTRPQPSPAGVAARNEGPYEAGPVERFDRPSEALMTIYSRSPEALQAGTKVAKGVAGLALGGTLGAFAGLHTGFLAGAAGAATLALPGAMLGAVAAGVVAEKLGTTGSDTAGAAIWGGVVGLVGSAAAGAYVGSQISGPAAAIGLGLAGAIGGTFLAAT